MWMFGRIPKLKVWNKSDVLAVFDSTENDGKGRIGISSIKNGYILSMKNINSLYRGGYLRKFVICAREAVSTQVFPERSYDTLAWIGIEFDEEKNGSIVRRILDDKSLSKCAKFAAIVSILVIQPEVSDDRLMDIVKKQIPPESVPEMEFWRNLWFILPDFATTDRREDRVHDGRKWSKNGLFNVFLNRASFVCHAREDEIPSEYFDRTGENNFKPSGLENSDLINELYNLNPKSLDHELKIDQAVKDMTAKKASRFYRYFTGTPSEFWPFISQQMDKDLMDIERRVMRSPLSYRVDRNISYYLGSKDLESIRTHFDATKNVEMWEKICGLGDYGAPVVALFFYKGGIQALIELISFCENEDRDSRGQGRRTLYSFKSMQNLEAINSLLNVLNEEYKDVPIAWALQLNSEAFKASENRIVASRKSTEDDLIVAL